MENLSLAWSVCLSVTTVSPAKLAKLIVMPFGKLTQVDPRNHTLDGSPDPTAEFRTRLSRGQAIGASLQKIWKSHSIPISTKFRLMKALVWPAVTYGCESWTLRKNEETHLEAFEMKGLRKILRVSWTAKKTNEWVLNKAE